MVRRDRLIGVICSTSLNHRKWHSNCWLSSQDQRIPSIRAMLGSFRLHFAGATEWNALSIDYRCAIPEMSAA